MNSRGQTDYHIHYHLDSCVSDEMTLANIVRDAKAFNLSEIAILKHYSHSLPNGEAVWVHWKRVIPEQFEAFLADIRSFEVPDGPTMLSGVETELVDDAGTINIPESKQQRLDLVQLSVHWLPAMRTIQADPVLVPGEIGRDSVEAAEAWRRQVRETGAEAIVTNFVDAYVKALYANPKVRVLAHMFDGLFPLRKYEVPVDELGEEKLLALMEPLMHACSSHHVLWELLPEPVVCPAILARAAELGVCFTATGDIHYPGAEGWGNFSHHAEAEAYIDYLGLPRGTLQA